MKNLDMNTLVEKLWNGTLSKLATIARNDGPCNPIGDGDAKTNAPGTYRPVGPTCAKECPFLNNGCYAQSGNVAMHQRRAQDDVGASLRSAAVAMVWAVRTNRMARLHVSGDFLTLSDKGESKIDKAYIRGLCKLADTINELSGRTKGTTIAWSYTHIPYARVERYVRVLARHGIIVRYSDHMNVGGAIVAPFGMVSQLRANNPGVKFAKCPAQLSDTTCVKCTLCWSRTDLTVVFDPHGSGKKKVTNTVLKVLQ